MKSYAPHAAPDLPLAVTAAVTTWFTMWAWRGVSADWGEFLGPLLVVAVTVSLSGAALRCSPLQRRASFTLQVLVVLLVVWVSLGGSVAHPLATSHEVVLAVRDAWVSAATNAAPVPESVPSIAPLVIVCGTGVLLLVDVLACQHRRVPLAGLCLVAVYVVPVIGLDQVVAWPVFAAAAAGFLLMMFLQQSARVLGWGRSLGAIAVVGSNASPVRIGTMRDGAALVGCGAVLLAVSLPAIIPTLHLNAPDVFHADGRGDSLKVTDPIATMRRGLHRGTDLPLLDVATNDPHPSYLRLAVLTQFDGDQWTTGSRDVGNQVGDGPMPLLEPGLSAEVPVKTYEYTVTAKNLDSTWLPTQFPISRLVAPGTWNYDLATMDVFAGDSETSTAGITYQMTAAMPRLSARSLSDAASAPPGVLASYTAPAESLPEQVYSLAARVTQGVRNPYRMAVRLQDWFRSTGGFRYDLEAVSGDNDNALVDFLSHGEGGLVGYCEQFASAYAAMARVLGIPARVAVGYLNPTRAPNGDWIYSAHDYHAWPEVYFQGSGWVRFEPTPAARAATVPPWTDNPEQPNNADRIHHDADEPPTGPMNHHQQIPPDGTSPTTASPPSDTGASRTGLLAAVAVLVILATLMPIPGAVRRSRRTRRLAGGVEDAWAELHDTAVDLRLSWPAGRSPHETGAWLAEWLAGQKGRPPGRRSRGGGPAPDLEPALDRIVLMLEQVRYAPSANDDPGALAGDVRTCIQALEQGCPHGTVWRARWLPKSMLVRRFKVRRAVEPGGEAIKADSVHDHIA